MRIILTGTSSSGKTSIVKLLPNNVKKLSMDKYNDKIYCDNSLKPPHGLYKNKYYTPGEKWNISNSHRREYFKSEIKKSKNFIIDTVEDAIFLKNYLKMNDVKSVLLYTDLEKLIKNIERRRNYEPRGLFVFQQFTEFYTFTNNEDEAIDCVCLKDFIENLKNIKYLFSNEKELITIAKIIFKKLNIKYLKMDKKYHIKPQIKYDIILNSKNKTSKKLVKELYQ